MNILLILICLGILSVIVVLLITKKKTNNCQPNCDGKKCGDNDGCGGSCTSCPSGSICNNGKCVCQLNCDGKKCDDNDECGGSCSCSSGSICNNGKCVCTDSNQVYVDGKCVHCIASCEIDCGYDCTGKACQPCPFNNQCNLETGQCETCKPDCSGKSCGDSDGCGDKCISCPSGYNCDQTQTEWKCKKPTSCTGKLCGDSDGEGGNCVGSSIPCKDAGNICNTDGSCTPINVAIWDNNIINAVIYNEITSASDCLNNAKTNHFQWWSFMPQHNDGSSFQGPTCSVYNLQDPQPTCYMPSVGNTLSGNVSGTYGSMSSCSDSNSCVFPNTTFNLGPALESKCNSDYKGEPVGFFDLYMADGSGYIPCTNIGSSCNVNISNLNYNGKCINGVGYNPTTPSIGACYPDKLCVSGENMGGFKDDNGRCGNSQNVVDIYK